MGREYSRSHKARLKKAGQNLATARRIPHTKGSVDYNEARARKVQAEAELAELKLAEQKGRLVEVDRVLKSIRENVARARAMLDAAFRSELPAKQGGLPADQIAAMNTERLEEIYKVLSK